MSEALDIARANSGTDSVCAWPGCGMARAAWFRVETKPGVGEYLATCQKHRLAAEREPGVALRVWQEQSVGKAPRQHVDHVLAGSLLREITRVPGISRERLLAWSRMQTDRGGGKNEPRPAGSTTLDDTDTDTRSALDSLVRDGSVKCRKNALATAYWPIYDDSEEAECPTTTATTATTTTPAPTAAAPIATATTTAPTTNAAPAGGRAAARSATPRQSGGSASSEPASPSAAAGTPAGSAKTPATAKPSDEPSAKTPDAPATSDAAPAPAAGPPTATASPSDDCNDTDCDGDKPAEEPPVKTATTTATTPTATATPNRSRKVLAYLAEHPECMVKDIAAALDITLPTLAPVLGALRDLGMADCDDGHPARWSWVVPPSADAWKARAESAEAALDIANDALQSARTTLGEDDGPFICDAIARIKSQRDDARGQLVESETGWRDAQADLAALRAILRDLGIGDSVDIAGVRILLTSMRDDANRPSEPAKPPLPGERCSLCGQRESAPTIDGIPYDAALRLITEVLDIDTAEPGPATIYDLSRVLQEIGKRRVAE